LLQVVADVILNSVRKFSVIIVISKDKLHTSTQE